MNEDQNSGTGHVQEGWISLAMVIGTIHRRELKSSILHHPATVTGGNGSVRAGSYEYLNPRHPNHGAQHTLTQATRTQRFQNLSTHYNLY
jgi:hypothetical protein